MEKHPFLPRLKSSANSAETTKLASFDKRGEWRIEGSIGLSDLSKSLEIDKIDPDYIEVDSIPDMWARPLLFEMAFKNKDHLLHERFIAEWRGLLAMLALKEIRNLPIDCAEVTIPKREKHEPQTDEEKKRAQAAPDFIQALGDLVPHSYIVEHSDWHRLYVILFDGRPIGMTSPTTLACTAVNYFNRIHPDVAWFSGRLLLDPTNIKPDKKNEPRVSCLNSDEKKSLIEWLEHVKTKLAKLEVITQNSGEMLERLIEEINGFQKHLGLSEGQQIEPPKLSNQGLHLEHGIFGFLDKPVKPQEETPNTSYVKLQSLGRASEPAPALLVIDDDIATQWDMPKQNVVVIGATTLSSIPYSGLGADRTRFGDKPLQGAEWVKPEMFFTQKLFYVARKNALPGCQQVEGMPDMSFQSENITPILPIQPWLLKYLSLDELRRRFAFEKTNDGIMARLTLPLRGPDGKGQDFAIKKEYRNANNDLQVIRQLPVIEAWPDFNAENWKAYYTYYSHEKGAKTFYATPIAPGAEIELQRKPGAAGSNGKSANTSTTPPETKSFKDNLIECETLTGTRLEQITKLDRFPEALGCFYDLPNTSLKKFETITAGIILLKQPASGHQADDWKIGIDFGTTGTNVYCTDGKFTPRPLEFRDHFMQVTDSAAADRADTIIYRFVAGKNAVAPFLTIFHDFRIADPADPTLRPLLDGHIFFKNEEAHFDAKDVSMHTNLKWGTGREDRKRARAFLTQLCFQSAAEAVSLGARNVTWFYSYPTAFSAGEINQFRQAWKSIIKTCNELTGLTPAADASAGPIAKTESVASGQFFADNPNIKTEASFGDKGACLDIGGGTTDISVWHDNTLRWQSSIRFAGRNMLMRIFYRNPAFLKNFEKDQELASLFDLAKAQEEIKFYAQLDVLLKERGKKWLEHLHLNAGEPAMIGLIQLIALSLSGLTFYVGQVLGALNSDPDPERKFPAELPNVFVGGNGARMFDWLTGGEKYTIKSPIGGLFKTMLLAGSGFNTKQSNFQICTSPEPKSEAAYGLVSDSAKLKGIDQQATSEESDGKEKSDGKTQSATLGVIAGEQFVENGIEKDWSEKISSDSLHKGLSKPNQLKQFRKFLEAFKGYTTSPSTRGIINPLQEDEPSLRACLDDLAQQLASAKAGTAEEVRVEPLFITVLKHFLDIKTEKWASSQQPV